jgi:hypothetical protein
MFISRFPGGAKLLGAEAGAACFEAAAGAAFSA